jgi:FemAB-related protein (PEP-CTERM system-associated)
MDSTEIQVKISDGQGWDEYVLGHPGSFFYHLFGWKNAFEDTFNFKTYYLHAERGAKITGILPLVLVSTIFVKKLVSIPIGVYAGVLADSENTAAALIEYAKSLTRQLNCQYLELRSIDCINNIPEVNESYVTFIKPLPASPDQCIEDMPRKARAAARHAIEAGLAYKTGLSLLDECYHIYAVNQRHLGSPVVSRKWFYKLAEIFKGSIDVLAVYKSGRCIAAVLTFFHHDTALPFYGASDPAFFKYGPSNYMYLKLEECAKEKGCKFFDFGRSRKNSGSYYFKINQGFTPTQLHYQYYLYKTDKVRNISPANSIFTAAGFAWRYMPLSLTKLAGPGFFKQIIP